MINQNFNNNKYTSEDFLLFLLFSSLIAAECYSFIIDFEGLHNLIVDLFSSGTGRYQLLGKNILPIVLNNTFEILIFQLNI